MLSKIEKRILKAEVKPKIGQKVIVTRKDGSQYIGEIISIHAKIKNWILEVQKVDDDGKVEVEEVANLVVDAVLIVKDVLLSDIWQAAKIWIKKLFKRK